MIIKRDLKFIRHENHTYMHEMSIAHNCQEATVGRCVRFWQDSEANEKEPYSMIAVSEWPRLSNV